MARHMPNVRTLLMIEKAILDSEDYPTRTELYESLPKKVHYTTFKTALEYLEASGKIIFNEKEIVYTGVNNPKLQKLIETSVIFKTRKK